MPKNTKLVITQDPADPIEKNILAAAIVEISKSVRKLEAQGLAQDAIIVLVQHAIPVKHKVNLRDVRAVLKSLGDLQRNFTTK